MTTHMQDLRRHQACQCQFPSLDLQRQYYFQEPIIPTRHPVILHKVAHYQSYQSQYGARPDPFHCYTLTDHTNMASPLHAPVDVGQDPPVKEEYPGTFFDSFVDEWHINGDDSFKSPVSSEATTADLVAFSNASDDLCGSSLTLSSFDSIDPSIYNGQISKLDTSFKREIKPEFPRSQPLLYEDNLIPPTNIGLPDDYHTPIPHEPSKFVSPQAVFTNGLTDLAATPSPVLSAQDGYGSSDGSFHRYGSESPLSRDFPRFRLGDNTPMAVPTSHWWSRYGPAYPSHAYSSPTSVYATSSDSDVKMFSSRSQPLLESQYADSAYAATDSGDDTCYGGPQAIHEREEKNRFLVQARLAGKSYREIRRLGKFHEAESTLRGRFRDLTKRKHERVRKPVWTRRDVKLLTEAVEDHMGQSHHPHQSRREKNAAIESALSRVPWKKVSAYIADNGGSYTFGNATCKKKYTQLAGLK